MSGRRALLTQAAVVAVVLSSLAASPASGQGDVDRRVVDIERRTTALIRRVESISGDVKVSETPDEVEVVLAADVLFAFDSAELTPGAESRLGEAAQQLADGGQSPVQVVGHTDSVGDTAYNQDLSQRRAEAVSGALAALVPDLTYEVEGRGEAEPVVDETTDDGGDDPEARARNRRVAITFARRA